MREYEIIAVSGNEKILVGLDKKNAEEIRTFISQSDRYIKKWRHLLELILGGHKNSDLYDKEEINNNSKGVTAMKFFKGQENDRLYCKEIRTIDGKLIIIIAEIYRKKKSQKISRKEIPIIEKVGSYEYTI